MIFQMWNGPWNKQTQVAQASVAYLDKHSTLDPLMISAMSSIPNGRGNVFDNFFNLLVEIQAKIVNMILSWKTQLPELS